MGDVLSLAPAAHPLHRDEVKDHRKVEGTDEDARIDALIAAAVDHVETYTRRALVRQTRILKQDRFGGRVVWVPRTPLRAVSSITYVDTDGNTQTLASTEYRVDVDSEPGRITEAYGKTWPSILDVTNAVQITYVAGFATPFTADTGTDTLTAAAHPYADGDVLQLYNSGGALPAGLSANTNYYVVNSASGTLQLAASAGGAAIDITDTGSGTHFLGVVPAPIRQAMLLLIGHWFENTEAVMPQAMHEMPLAVEALLAPWRVMRF